MCYRFFCSQSKFISLMNEWMTESYQLKLSATLQLLLNISDVNGETCTTHKQQQATAIMCNLFAGQEMHQQQNDLLPPPSSSLLLLLMPLSIYLSLSLANRFVSPLTLHIRALRHSLVYLFWLSHSVDLYRPIPFTVWLMQVFYFFRLFPVDFSSLVRL